MQIQRATPNTGRGTLRPADWLQRVRRAVFAAAALAVTTPALPDAQQSTPAMRPATELDSLVARALAVNPQIVAARQRASAAAARVRPAGALLDPMLGVGITNFPISDPPMTAHSTGSPTGFSDPMTMKMVALEQTLPYPGKLGWARRAAERERDAAEAQVRAAQLEVAAEVRKAYFELAFLERALEVLENNQKLLVTLMQATEARYAVGAGGQQDVLKARVETARLADEAVVLAEQRHAQLARLNALLDRGSESPIAEPRIPERLVRAAVSTDPERIRFRTAALGARVADSPLPPLEQLQEQAIRNNPLLRAQQSMIDAQAVRLELARKAYLPDFDVSLQYGQRVNNPDMVSVMVSVPLPVNRRNKQNQQVAEARAEQAALEAERDAMRNRLRADLAETYSNAEKSRAQLALLVTTIIPQGRAARESSTTAFQVGRVEFLTVIENQATLYSYETAYFRALADFAASVAELEQLIGTEVLR